MRVVSNIMFLITPGYQVAQIRAIFLLSDVTCREVFGSDTDWPSHLAYVDWFSPFPRAPQRDSLMYRVRREYRAGDRLASVIPIHNIKRSVMLFPKFGPIADRSWTSEDVLEKCNEFYVNPFVDEHSYRTIC